MTGFGFGLYTLGLAGPVGAYTVYRGLGFRVGYCPTITELLVRALYIHIMKTTQLLLSGGSIQCIRVEGFGDGL